ncbi:hypothetical protein ERO13_D07G135850v2 [Gossypium hirsutum]|nr:hypothetical protein ERO13_D07G135850v2 [Gossypium hirsutum]
MQRREQGSGHKVRSYGDVAHAYGGLRVGGAREACV